MEFLSLPNNSNRFESSSYAPSHKSFHRFLCQYPVSLCCHAKAQLEGSSKDGGTQYKLSGMMELADKR